MAIVSAIMVPHPPVAVPEVGRGRESEIQATLDALRSASETLISSEPDTVVVLSPHSVMYGDYFHISPGKSASGDLSAFGAAGVKFGVLYDTELVSRIEEMCVAEGVSAGRGGERNASLDHAAVVPLYFIREQCGGDFPFRFVRIGLSGLPLTEHYKLGMVIKKAAESLGRKVAIVASGDLSHVLKEDGPYGFHEAGPEYDERIMDIMERGSFGELFDFEEGFEEAAAVCGHRSFVIMAGAFDGTAVRPERLSYEGTFGVGYGVCTYLPAGRDSSRFFLDEYMKAKAKQEKEARDGEDEYVSLARAAIEKYVLTGEVLEVPKDVSAELLTERAGVFVSMKKDGMLRGCIGTIRPEMGSVAAEIIRNAISSAIADPRFERLRPDELEHLTLSVDVLKEPEYIESVEELDAKKYGVIVTSGNKRGLLLPNLEGVDTPEQQIDIAARKAGIEPGSTADVQRFEVVRHY